MGVLFLGDAWRKGGGPIYRSAGACPPRSLACPRVWRPPALRSSPYGKRYVFFIVARGPVPRDLPCTRWLGEGQALALR